MKTYVLGIIIGLMALSWQVTTVSAQNSSVTVVPSVPAASPSASRSPSPSVTNTQVPTVTEAASPSATVTQEPSVTTDPQPSPVCKESEGDANNDGKATLKDYEIFRQEFSGELTTLTADFNCDGTVTLVDFEKFRAAFIK